MEDLKQIQEFFSKPLGESTLTPDEIASYRDNAMEKLANADIVDKKLGKTRYGDKYIIIMYKEKWDFNNPPKTGMYNPETQWVKVFYNDESEIQDLIALKETKPLEENTFKVGQKVTYLGHPAVVTATKEYNGRNFVSVSYDKGTGATKASMILATSGDVKPLKENIDINYMELIHLIKTADNPRNLSIYYNSDHNVVNIGGVGYDGGELAQKFNSKPGQSSNIKSLFYKANQSFEETVEMVNNMNAGVEAELKYGYGNEPFVVYKKVNVLKEGKQLDIKDFAKVVKAVEQTGHPVTVLLVPKFNEIEIITGMNAPDDMLRDLSDAVDSLGYGRNDIIIAGDSSNLSRREYSDIRRVNGGAKDYFEESLDEAKRPEPNYKELVKLLIMAFKHEPKARFYFNRNNGAVYFDLIGGAAYSPKKSKMRDIFGGMNPIAVNREFGRADHHEEETIKQVEQLSNGKIKAEIKELGDGVLYKLKDVDQLEEMDFNDPIAMRLRANKMKREKEAAKPKRRPLYGKQRQKVEDALLYIDQELKGLYSDKKYTLIDMEQEAEPEGGPIADRYGDELNKIENQIQALIAKRDKLEARLDESLEEAKKYKKGDKLKVKLKNGKEFDITFDSYSSNKGIAYGKIDGDRKPFSLDAVVSEATVPKLNEAKGDQIAVGNYVKTQHGDIYKRVEGTVGGRPAFVSVEDGKEGKRKTGLHDSVKLTLVNKGELKEDKKLTYNDFVQMVRDDMMAGSSPDEKPSDEQVRRRAKSYYNDYLQGASVDDLFEATKKEYNALLDKEHELTKAYSKDKTDANWKKLSAIRKKGKKLEKELKDQGLLEYNTGLDYHPDKEKSSSNSKKSSLQKVKDMIKTAVKEGDITVDDKTEFKVDLKHLLDKHVIQKEDLSDYEETEADYDELYSNYLYKMVKEVATEKGFSKYLKSKDNPKGETDGLTPDVLNKILMNVIKDIKETNQIDEGASTEEKRIAMSAIKRIAKYRGVSEDEARNDLIRAAKELGSLKEAIKEIFETIKLGQNLNEELCPKGKAYIKKRKAAGEKSSAYLSGRAVKVCKGQMKG